MWIDHLLMGCLKSISSFHAHNNNIWALTGGHALGFSAHGGGITKCQAPRIALHCTRLFQYRWLDTDFLEVGVLADVVVCHLTACVTAVGC